MQYINKEDLRESLQSTSDKYILLDVRKTEDYNNSHIRGSYAIDLDTAVKDGDNKTGIANLEMALNKLDENIDNKYVIVCYVGGPTHRKQLS